MMHHPQPWWYRLAARVAPGRCREIPEATDPTGQQIVLRQVALVHRYVYLQQFSSSENPNWMHSHQWAYTFAIGLWGAYTEHRPGARARTRRAPYAYGMDSEVVHHVQNPSPGHTSIFVGFFRDDDLKYYHEVVHLAGLRVRTGVSRLWSDHIKVMVKRI